MTNYMNKVKETVGYGTAKANETFQHGTREITRVANDVGSGIQKVAAQNKISSPLPSDLITEVNQAASILNAFTDPNKAEGGTDNVIPKEVFLKAKGFAIFTVLKAGMVWSGRVGTGIVIAKTEDGTWSSPSCINIAGVGFGAQFGANVTDHVIVLNTDEAVKAFSHKENLNLGGDLAVTVGPMGRGAGVSSSIYERSPSYSYSSSKGFFAGVSVEGTVIIERKDANKEFYGKEISAAEILSGKPDLKPSNTELYDIIKRVEEKH